MPSLLGLVAALLVLGAVFGVLEHVARRRRGQPGRLLREGWGTDVAYLFVTALLTKPLARLLVIVAAALLVLVGLVPAHAFQDGAYAGFGPLSRQPGWLQALQVLALVDLIGYWSHRLFHRRGWWPFHAVHHASERLDWLSSLRVHPVNDVVTKLLQAVPLLLLGYDPAVTLGAAPVLTLYALLLHADVTWDFGPLRWVIASPVFHRWHHSRHREAWDRNFAGLLPAWDLLFGTFYMPRGQVPSDFGIHEPMPPRLVGQLAAPFARAARRPQGADAA